MYSRCLFLIPVLLLVACNSSGTKSVAVDAETGLMPLTITLGDHSGTGAVWVYTARTYLDKKADTCIGPVLIYRQDTRPSESREPISEDGSAYLVLYPNSHRNGQFTGRESEYQASDGEIVLYRFENDSFSSVGRLPLNRPQKEQIEVVHELMRKIASADESSRPSPSADTPVGEARI
jgi:hypothetical protein